MREIEIKVRVADKEQLLAALERQNIIMGQPITQHDVVYGPKASGNPPGTNWLRIRTQSDGKVLFTFKKSVVGHLDCIEHETAVEDASELEKILTQLGYALYSDLTKTRSKGRMGDIELCLDEVSGLGTFIEAEKLMQEDANHDAVVAELWQLLSGLGLQKADEVHEGYDVLERQQKGLPR